MHVDGGARGKIDENNILNNQSDGIWIREGGNPIVRRNLIKGNRRGVVVNNAGGTFQDNDFADNRQGAWSISSGDEANVIRIGKN